MSFYDSSSITSSSRLTPAEEEELRSNAEVAKLSQTAPPEDLKAGTGNTTLVVPTVTVEAFEGDTPAATKGSYKKKKRQSLYLEPPGRVLIAVIDKSGKKGSRKQGVDVDKDVDSDADDADDGGSQILASATMDDAEFEEMTHRESGAISATPPPASVDDAAAKAVATVRLEASVPQLIVTDDIETEKDLMNSKPVAVSSGASVISTSPTLTSSSFHQRKSSSAAASQHSLHQLQQREQQSTNTTSLTLEATGPPPSSTLWLDPEHFKIVFRELGKYTEQIQQLNDHILEAMTLFQPLSTTSSANTSPTMSRAPPSPEEARRRMKGKEKAIDLDEDRFSVAQSFTDLVMDSWPRIYKIPMEPKTAQMTKDRIKTATKLKNAIVEFWSAQSHFQEQAQLVLDVYQDPTELEHGDRVRMLKSRHLNNLLSQEPLDPHEIRLLLQRYRRHNDKMSALSEQLQNVWLGILMLLGDPDQKQSSKLSRRLGLSSMHLHGAASSSSSYYLDQEFLPTAGGGGLFRLSRNKKLGLKVTVLLALGSGMIAMALVLNTR